MKPVAMCWTINTGTGKSRGSIARMVCNTGGPPVEAPMAITLIEADEIIDACKKNNVKFGRQYKLTQAQVTDLQNKRKQSGCLIKNLMLEYKISKATVYRYLSSKSEY